MIALLLFLCAVPVLAATAYLLLLTALSRPLLPPPIGIPRHRFEVIVPAHQEEAGIARTVRSLLALDYPAELFNVRVVADNCTDATALNARNAGAHVWERREGERRGKGHALRFAYERVLEQGWADAVVVVDADSLASPNLLKAFSARLHHGADAVQAEYVVANRDASWRTQLMTFAFSLFHTVRGLGRERLALSCGLRGNGMCFSTKLLAARPHRAYSLVEDVEYGLALGRAGVRVHFVHEARVLGEMVASEKGSRSQRRRWEHGRAALRRAEGASLLFAGLKARNVIAVDLAVDLLVPPLGNLVALISVGALLSAVLWYFGGGAAPLLAWSLSALMLSAHLARGWQLSGLGLRATPALLRAPLYVVWKLLLRARPARAKDAEWIRTAREGDTA